MESAALIRWTTCAHRILNINQFQVTFARRDIPARKVHCSSVNSDSLHIYFLFLCVCVLSFVWHLIRLPFRRRLFVQSQCREFQISHNLAFYSAPSTSVRTSCSQQKHEIWLAFFAQRPLLFWNWFMRKLFPFCNESFGDSIFVSYFPMRFIPLFFFSLLDGWRYSCSLFVVWLLA